MPERTDRERRAQADWLVALAEPTRLSIVRALAAGEMGVPPVAAAVQAALTNVSHHLGVLRAAGVVEVRRAGRNAFYSLAGATVSGGAVELTHPSGLTVSVPLG